MYHYIVVDFSNVPVERSSRLFSIPACPIRPLGSYFFLIFVTRADKPVRYYVAASTVPGKPDLLIRHTSLQKCDVLLSLSCPLRFRMLLFSIFFHHWTHVAASAESRLFPALFLLSCANSPVVHGAPLCSVRGERRAISG